MSTPSLTLPRRATHLRRRPVRRANLGGGRAAQWRGALAAHERASAPRLARYLPLVLLVTACVVVAPAAFAAFVIPPSGALGTVASGVLAAAVSLALARLMSTLWRRYVHRADLTLPELLLLGWLRRCYAERRLWRVRAAYQAAVAGNCTVRLEMLEGVARLLAVRNAYAHGHCRRVARHAERIAYALGLDRATAAKVRTAALVHDVGKVYTPREILNKPGRLTEQEFAVIKQHAVDGAELLAPVRDPELAQMVRSHHERLDGSGYPDALRGEEIPIGARIIAVADTFDAITSSRPYRKARSHKQGAEVLLAERGTRLDADAVDGFLAGHRPAPSVSLPAALAAAAERTLALPRLLASAVGGGLGGGSLAQLVPALGAAGLLAASGPIAKGSAFGGQSAAGAGVSLVTPIGPPVPAVSREVSSPGAPSSGSGPQAGARGPRARGRLRRVPGAPLAKPGAAGGSFASPTPSATPGGGSGTPAPPAPRELPTVPGIPPVEGPHGGPPPITPPPVTPPPVTPPPVTPPPVTPPVSLPPVSTPPITTPHLTVPPVTTPLPPVTVPTVTVPAIHL